MSLLDLEKLTPHLWRRKTSEGGAYYFHWCQGCKHAHRYPVGIPGTDNNWSFNDNYERPSFGPSMLIFSGGWNRSDGTQVPRRTHCHYFLTDGILKFCSDSPHEFSGQNVALEPIPGNYEI